MPLALCFVVPPAAIMVSSISIPKGVDEAGYVDALVGAPIDAIKCETSETFVPADAEIVLRTLSPPQNRLMSVAWRNKPA